MHRSRAFIVTLLTLTLCVGFAAPASGVTNSDVAQHQEAADRARAAAEKADANAVKLGREVDKLGKRIDDLQDQADALSPKIKTAEKRTDALQAQIVELEDECARTQTEIDATQASYDTQRALLADRVQASYKQGNWFYLDVLLGSASFDDLISRTELVTRVIESNNNIASDLERSRDTLVTAKVALDRSLEQVTLKKREAAEVEGELKDLRAARQAKVNAQVSIQNQQSTLLNQNKANAKRLRALAEAEERESERLAAMLSGSGSGHFSGTMAWPVPASSRITSNYGMRICPFHGREFHPGIDIGAPLGSPIVAAGDGKVIVAGWRGGYGNTIILDHGNGVTTTYAHQTNGGLKVSVGTSVSRGERIGTVGSTGSSTGPHLHFEVRVNGSPRNPSTYR